GRTRVPAHGPLPTRRLASGKLLLRRQTLCRPSRSGGQRTENTLPEYPRQSEHRRFEKERNQPRPVLFAATALSNGHKNSSPRHRPRGASRPARNYGSIGLGNAPVSISAEDQLRDLFDLSGNGGSKFPVCLRGEVQAVKAICGNSRPRIQE